MKDISGTLIFVIKEGKVLLAKKKRVLGVGLYNGYGGKFEIEEGDVCMEDCAKREFNKEAGGNVGGATIRKRYLNKVGHVVFHNGDDFIFRCDIFTCFYMTGKPKETDEMGEPVWFPVDDLPSAEKFIDGDLEWLPLILRDKKKIKGHIWRDKDFKLVGKGVDVRVVDEF